MKNQDKLLKLLKEFPQKFVSGEVISKELSVSRAMIWKEIQSLKQSGYDIEAVTHRGYKLLSAPDKLFADEIQFGLKSKWMGKRIYSYEDLASTNTAAWKLGEEGLPQGTCVFAEHQKKGRGRLGRTWASPKGRNLLFSVLLRPSLEPSAAPRLTLITALAVAKAVLKETGIRLGVKWPNDLIYEEKKVCGILTEMSAETDQVLFVILGIGVNVNAKLSELPPGATSLREILGKKLDRVALARRILEQLEKVCDRLAKNDIEALCEEWEELSETSGKRITATLMDRTLHGMATGIDKDGALWIRQDNGLQQRILSGDIQHLRKK